MWLLILTFAMTFHQMSWAADASCPIDRNEDETGRVLNNLAIHAEAKVIRRQNWLPACCQESLRGDAACMIKRSLASPNTQKR